MPSRPLHQPLTRRDALQASASLGAAALLPSSAVAAGFDVRLPKAIYRFIVGSPPGGSSDVLARLLARHLTTLTGHTFVVDNKPGANGISATLMVARRHPHDVLIFVGLGSHLLINQLVYPKMPLDLRTDLSRLYLLCTGTTYLTTNPKTLPVASLAELLCHLQRHKGLTLGSYGVGSYPHLLGKRLNQITGGGLVHVPYQGEAPMVHALLSGELDLGWASAKYLRSHAKQLLPLAGHSPQRLPNMPHIPTFAEAGLPDPTLSRRGWIGTAVSAQLPVEIKHALGAAIAKVVASASMKRSAMAMGITLVQNSSPDSFEHFYEAEYQAWAGLIDAISPIEML